MYGENSEPEVANNVLESQYYDGESRKQVVPEYSQDGFTDSDAIVVDASEPSHSESSDLEIIESNSIEPNETCDSESAKLDNDGNTSYPLADDFEKLARRMMKNIPDYPVEDSTFFVWEIKDWATIRKENKVVSPHFKCGGYNWSILLFPRGNSDSVSLYLEPQPVVAGEEDVNPDWYVCAQFALDIWNPAYPSSHYPSGSSHRFNKNETDWGFSSFISSKDMVNPSKVGQAHAILEDNKINITAFVRVIDDSSTGVLWSNFVDYNSKLNTGYVGLNNQGATCYLNSLLQSYFATTSFRNLVYEIPTQDQIPGSASNKNSKMVALALQRIFCLMQSSEEPVGTMELTKSFGWDSSEAFTQHDVQELNRVLMDKLEHAMKGSSIENKLNDIFVGKMKSYIKCVNVSYESSRVEEFWDIQLNVKGFRNLQDSFKNYVEIEMLDGENKYQAGEGHGYQDAKKGVVFESFPPVLHLQLKRFEYDFMVDDLVKIDDFYEFPDNIDLSPYLDSELDDSVRSQNWNYQLHGVLVHQGSISNGHYYAMIKPERYGSNWLRFDDDKVWKVTPNQVFRENFGAADLSTQQIRSLSRMEQNEYLIRKATSAYMLVYYREETLSTVLPKTVSSVPDHVSGQIEREREESAKIEKAKREALYYLQVKFVTADNFTHFDGFDICPDPARTKEYGPGIFDEKSLPTILKVRKDAKFFSLYRLIAQKLGYEKSYDINLYDSDQDGALSNSEDEDQDWENTIYPFELMTMKQRNNKTSRPDCEVPREDLHLSVDEVYTKHFKKRYDELAFFVREPRRELHNIITASTSVSPGDFSFEKVSFDITSNALDHDGELRQNQITLFLKYFDPISNTVRGLTFVDLSKTQTLSSITHKINALLGFGPSTPLEFFEETSRIKIDSVDSTQTLEKCELGTGDIVAVQLADLSSFSFKFGPKNVQEYFNFLLTRLHIQVKPFKVTAAAEDTDFVNEDLSGGLQKESKGTAASTTVSVSTGEVPRSFDLWISTAFSYQELAARIASHLGKNVDPRYLRLFFINNQGARIPLASTTPLTQLFSRQVAVSSISQFEYEMLNITLKEYENMKSIRIHWLESIYQEQVFDLLMPKGSQISDLVCKLVAKLDLNGEKSSGLLCWTGQDHKYSDLLKFDRSIDEISDDVDVYCGYYPAEVEILVSHDMFKRFSEPEAYDGRAIADPIIKNEYEKAKKYSKSLNIIPVFHFAKSTAFTHSKPFVFAAFPDEPFVETRERLRKKLGLGISAFEKVKIALADSSDKGRYLDVEKDGFSLLDEISKFDSHVSLALDHRDKDPRRANPSDKGITIG